MKDERFERGRPYRLHQKGKKELEVKRSGSAHLSLAQVLRRDLREDQGAASQFGRTQRNAMIFERALLERRLAGEALENLEALIDCLVSHFDEFDRGTLSSPQLLETLWATVQIMDAQTRYSEVQALQSTVGLDEALFTRL